MLLNVSLKPKTRAKKKKKNQGEIAVISQQFLSEAGNLETSSEGFLGDWHAFRYHWCLLLKGIIRLQKTQGKGLGYFSLLSQAAQTWQFIKHVLLLLIASLGLGFGVECIRGVEPYLRSFLSLQNWMKVSPGKVVCFAFSLFCKKAENFPSQPRLHWPLGSSQISTLWMVRHSGTPEVLNSFWKKYSCAFSVLHWHH